jgi:hypothetical protein
VKILETRFWEKLVEGSFWENLENKLKRRGPKEAMLQRIALELLGATHPYLFRRHLSWVHLFPGVYLLYSILY